MIAGKLAGLSKCPLCHSIPIIRVPEMEDGKVLFCVVCPKCGDKGGIPQTNILQAAAKWNAYVDDVTGRGS